MAAFRLLAAVIEPQLVVVNCVCYDRDLTTSPTAV
jgi:hypothetical protein